ncbi:MAG: diacylglycerol kinase family protein [Myxococcota bacterium]|nr:diacylglycerol kinase family protein [Myxococcota bacterium]
MARESDVERRDGAFSWAARRRSFRHAFRGVGTLLAEQHNTRIHAAVTLAVIVAGLVVGVSALEWAVLALAIGLVWAAEAGNSALEWLCDVASPDFHPLVRKAKDAAAAAVLVAAAAAAAAGLFVFVPYVL